MYSNNPQSQTIADALIARAKQIYKNPMAVPKFLLSPDWNNWYHSSVTYQRSMALMGTLQMISSRMEGCDPFNYDMMYGYPVMRDIRSDHQMKYMPVDMDGDRILHYAHSILNNLGSADPNTKYIHHGIRLGPLFTIENIMALTHATHYSAKVRDPDNPHSQSIFDQLRKHHTQPHYEHHYSHMYHHHPYRPFELDPITLIHQWLWVEDTVFLETRKEGMELLFLKMLMRVLDKPTVVEAIRWLYLKNGFRMSVAQMKRLKSVWVSWDEDERMAREAQ